MENWRKKGDKCNQELAITKSNHRYKKPLTGENPNWQPNIPYWEKRFVTSIGSLPWKTFLETKKFTHLYDNIMKWDDSAAHKAFITAKNQFYAIFHNLHCDIEPHNPDLYIGEIDWNGQVDHDLILDLESEPAVPDTDSRHEPVVIFGDVLPDPYKDFSPYGWGDSDDKIKKSCEKNWDDYIENGRIIWNENDNKTGDEGWNTNLCDDNNNNNYYSSCGNVNNERYVSNKKTWRFNGNSNNNNSNNNQRSRSWRNNGNWRKSTGQGYGSQHIQGHGSQRIHVHP